MKSVIIQARMGSSRLPGKIMLPVCNNPLLLHMINRIKQSKNVEKIIVATTINENDDVLEDFCKSQKIGCYRGSENDVISRYYEASKKFSVDTIIRLTADTPLLDYQTIDKVVDVYSKNNFDYVSNHLPFPRTFPDGYNVEVFPSELLCMINKKAKRPSDREHLNTFITMQPDLFKMHRVDHPSDLSKFRFNLDYEDDYKLIKLVFKELYPKNPFFSLNDIVTWLSDNPEIFKINSKIKPYQNIIKSFQNDLKQGFEPYGQNYYLSKS